jgi:hypothetical protein
LNRALNIAYIMYINIKFCKKYFFSLLFSDFRRVSFVPIVVLRDSHHEVSAASHSLTLSFFDGGLSTKETSTKLKAVTE